MRPAVIGTAGWGIASQVQNEFPASGTHLERYAARLNGVEINSSFYRHHRAQTYARWASSVPADFKFSVKIPKAITHIAGLQKIDSTLDRFLDEVGGLGAKLGALLVQLPPKLEFQRQTANRFFKTLRARTNVGLACEPRHVTWTSPTACRLLVSHAVARVAADPPLWPQGDEPGGWDGLVYYRLHGSPVLYRSNYDAEYLATIQASLAAAAARDVPAWCIFDNTIAGCALGNALTVRQATASAPRRKTRSPRRAVASL